jgi:uncharacterized protein YecE (DUF72 family)
VSGRAYIVYVRRHGVRTGSYSEAELAADARAIRGWLGEGRDVYAYFNNDHNAYAIANARRLRELLG